MGLSFVCWLAPAVCAAALTGCDLAPKYHVPVVSIPVSYKEASRWTEAVPADAMPRRGWWRMFGDPTLDGLEAQIDSGNPDLAAYRANFQQARAIAAEAYAGVYPTLGVGGHITTNRQSNRRPLRGANQPNQYLDNAVDVQANYEIDLWDRVANAVKAGRAAAQASAADLESLRLSLHAQLATNYAELRGFDVQERILADAVSQYRQALQMTEARFAGKIPSGLDVARAQTQLHDAEAALIDVQSSRALLEHSIALLIGKPPAELTIPPEPQQIREAENTRRCPSTILERRPDIASAERLVQAANATIGETRDAFYPTISLNLIYGFQDTGFNLVSLPNSFWSVGPGDVHANLRRRLARCGGAGGLGRLPAHGCRLPFDRSECFRRSRGRGLQPPAPGPGGKSGRAGDRGGAPDRQHGHRALPGRCYELPRGRRRTDRRTASRAGGSRFAHAARGGLHFTRSGTRWRMDAAGSAITPPSDGSEQ